jgi:hypothetical protein
MPVPVHHFGGRAVFGTSVFVLDLVPEGAAILSFEGAELHTVLRLATGKLKIEPFGIARDVDRRFHVLANRGRVEVAVDPGNGSVVGVTDLEVICQGIWNVGPEIVLAPLRADAGQSVLARASMGRLHPFATLTSRSGGTPVDNAIANVFACGASEGARLPCWWAAGDAEIFVIDGSGRERRMPVPSLASREADSRSKALGSGFVYPIRDAFFVNEDTLWVLTNQEGATTPFNPGGVRSRHLWRSGSRSATIPLAREGRAILLGSLAQVTVLYADGTVETLSSK